MARDRYKEVLEKLNHMDFGGSSFWKPPQGKSTIRLLPPVGTMDYFFVDTGTHYLGESNFYCPRLTTDGKERCPLCEANSILYDNGEVDMAKTFRVSKRYYMNIIDRSSPNSVSIYSAGPTVMLALQSIYFDGGYGDISDPTVGWDINIERSGEGKETKYQLRPIPAGKSVLAATPEAIKAIIDQARDLKKYVANKLLPYEQLAEESGASNYLSLRDAGEEDEDGPSEQETPPTPAAKAVSSSIASKLNAYRKSK